MLPEEDLEDGGLRMLEVDNRVKGLKQALMTLK
jgi:hypothetical protein